MYYRRTGLGAAAVALLALWPSGVKAQQVLYGITNTGGGNLLITIDTTTGAGTLVGPLSSNMDANGIAFRGPKLYAWDTVANRLRQLDPATAATLNTIDIGATGGGGDLDFRSDGIGFLVTAPARLIRFDITVPNSTVIAPTLFFNGLAFNSADVLYGSAGLLYTINQATAVPTPVSATALPPANSGGIAFNANGKLYAAFGNMMAGTSFLYTIDASTGASTLIGNIGFPGVSGIRFQPLPPPPPPPPPVGEAGTEGSFAGSDGPDGAEGCFGFGGHLAVQAGTGTPPASVTPWPALVGPFLDSQGLMSAPPGFAAAPPAGACLRVLNVSQRRASATGAGTAEPESSRGQLAWTVLAALAGAAVCGCVAVLFGPKGVARARLSSAAVA